MLTKKEVLFYKKVSPKLADVLKLKNDEDFYKNYTSKVFSGDEVSELDEDLFEDWINNRLVPNLIFLNKDDYLESAIEALETYKDIAKTDFGRSRQRDEAQLWADKIRGYLAEKVFQKKLLTDFNIHCKLPHESGNLKNYLSSDVPLIKKKGDEEFRKANKKTSIKMTKWNGVWLDIGGAQYQHSDYYVQIKVNTGTEHLVSFLKSSGLIEKYLLQQGLQKNIINDEKKNQIMKKIKNFEDISLFGYIAGFRDIKNTEVNINLKKKKSNVHIISAEGLFHQSTLNQIASENELRDKQGELDITKIKFQGIGEFSSFPRFLTNTGRLKFKHEDWSHIVNKF